jgi:hypothetical protein
MSTDPQQQQRQPTQLVPDPAEAGPLAREMQAAFARQLETYREIYKESLDEARARARGPLPDHVRERLLKAPPEQLSWYELHQVARQDPEGAVRRWEAIKQAARQDLQTGHRAAKAVEAPSPSPRERARFLALREELAREWQPRGGVEWQLIDTLAQAQTAWEFWMDGLMLRANITAQDERRGVRETGQRAAARVSDAQAIEQAGAMAERFNKICLRTLRVLHDLRRQGPKVVVRSAGQVNVGGQQVNLRNGDGHLLEGGQPATDTPGRCRCRADRVRLVGGSV